MLVMKRVLVKKFLYSGNFNLGKYFWHTQKVKSHLFFFCEWILATKWVFLKQCCVRMILRILSNEATISCLIQFYTSKIKTQGKRIPSPSTFSQLLPVYQIYVTKRSSLLRKVIFFYSARIKNFSQH